MNTVAKRSQTKSNAGAPALWFITIFILFWDVMVLRFLIPANNAPFLFKAIFVLVGLLFTVGTVLVWRDRILGGNVSLRLSIDPVPHGVQVPVQFELSKAIKAKTWSVEAKFESLHTGSENNHYSIIWSQVFPAHLISSQVVSSNFVFPSDYSPKNSKGDKHAYYNRVISLKADNFTWSFLLETRDATASEMLFDSKDVTTIGSNLLTYTPADIEKSKKYIARFKIASVLAFILIALAQFSSFFDFDFDLVGRAKAKVGLGAYSSQVTTDEFDVRVTNYLMNNWAFRGRLVGKGRVSNGTLRVQLENLEIQATNECKGEAKRCEISSVRLLLSDDGGNSFSTKAASEPVPINVQLRDITRWSLPSELIGKELVLQLPASIDIDTMRLKLEIRTAADSTVYPDSGPYLALHRALAKANKQQDPCEKITDRRRLVQAGCVQQLEAMHNKTLGVLASISASSQQAWHATRQYASKLGLGAAPKADVETLNNLLLEAIQSENFATAQSLLKLGASANAEDSYQVGRTALGYAAATKNIELVEQLLQAGAKANERKLNDRGQIVTPLTQALRADAANTIERLVKAGASIHTDDPAGWTPMHIAAYESSKLSLEVLVKAGADVNERTPAYRQQNVLQTALQFGDFDTASTLLKLGADPLFKDNQGENACGWAKFFKRSEKIQALVCNPS
jgi:Ankyrin repeats (3 copies)